MSLERQTIYGWPVAIDLFLGGLGGGAFLAGFVLNLFSIQEPITRLALLLGPLAAISGALFLLADITIRRRVYRLFANAKAWTSRGAWIITFFVMAGFDYYLISSPAIAPFSWLHTTGISLAMGAVAASFAVLVLIYPGFLMATLRAVPFWNTSLLAVLFLLSGLVSGVAMLLVLTPALRINSIGLTEILHSFGATIIILAILQAIVLYAFLKKAARGDAASRASLGFLKASRFNGKMLGLGLLVPLCLSVLAIFTDNMFLVSWLSLAAGMFFLAGGLYLRYAIIRAGILLQRFQL